MKAIFVLLLTVFFLVNLTSRAQREYPPVIEGAKEVTYKTIDDTKLSLWIFDSPSNKRSDKPAIVFFFGGGWNAGSPSQFVKHCEYLSSRGMLAIVADYRVKSRNNVTANRCVSDAKSAIRWVREHAKELGVDPEKIVASGGSAGGHLAAATASLPMFDEESEDKSIRSKPNALVLFNPALVLAPVEKGDEEQNRRMAAMEKRMGAKPESMSPYHNITAKMPPTLIFHGTNDTTVPFKTVELFTRKMHEFENTCILVAYEGEPHGFFNFGKKSNATFIDTVNKMDKFLVSEGYLEAPPESSVHK